MASMPQELKEKTTGIVVGLPTLFNDDFSINHDGMRTHVDFLIEDGVKVLMLSRGVSEWPYLTYEEIKAVTENVVRAASGRAIVITSTFDWWTGQAVEFAKYAQDVGADGCLVVLPVLYTGYNPDLHDDAFHRHFESIARASDIGLLIHERNMAGWSGAGAPLSISLLDRLADIDNVVGIKLEGGDRFYSQKVVRLTKDRLAIIGDWGPEAFFFSHGYGVSADITGVGQFAPKLVLQYWDDLKSGRLEQARRVANEVLTPYYVPVMTMDWVAAMKVSMEFVGLPASPMRPPNAQLTAEQRELLRHVMRQLGLLP